MLSSKIDRLRLARDIRALIADCIHLKRLLRTRWTRPMAEEQQRHLRLARHLTERFVLLAASRGRLHVIRRPRELAPDATWDAITHNRTIAERLLPEYATPETMTEARP
jgi:hypothetical protein